MVYTLLPMFAPHIHNCPYVSQSVRQSRAQRVARFAEQSRFRWMFVLSRRVKKVVAKKNNSSLEIIFHQQVR